MSRPLAFTIRLSRTLSSVTSELDDQTVPAHGEPLALALLDHSLGLLRRPKSDEASTLGLALVVEHNVDLLHSKVHVLECLCEGLAIGLEAQVSHIDSVDLASGLGLELHVARRVNDLTLHLVETSMSTTTASPIRVGSRVGS